MHIIFCTSLLLLHISATPKNNPADSFPQHPLSPIIIVSFSSSAVRNIYPSTEFLLLRSGSNHFFCYKSMWSHWYQLASIFLFFTVAPDYCRQVWRPSWRDTSFSRRNHEEYSCWHEGHCYKKPTWMFPAMVWLLVEACVSDMEELQSWITVKQNMTTGMCT
jgi:hypothetical protein